MPGSFDTFLDRAAKRCPGRFYGFTTALFAGAPDDPLYIDRDRFVAKTLATFEEHVQKGARGLKLLKELGLRHRDPDGNLIHMDAAFLDPVWEKAAELKVPVLVHHSDPYGFFQPTTPENEHYDTLKKYPDWSFADPAFPQKQALLERRDRVIRRHPGTVFILPHVANFAENLSYVAQLLDENPNVYIDFSARIDELGRQPYTSRDFFLRYQDRILFGTDMPASVEMYRCYFRFLETPDEYFIPPDYDGTFDRWRWRVYGLELPQQVLEKVYYRNALKVIPGLREDTALA